MAFFAFQIAGCGPMDGSEEDTTTAAAYTTKSIQLQISDASVDADGSSKSDVTATVKTSTNQAVPNTSYCQELCMEKLGGDPFFFNSIDKVYSPDYFC